MPTSGLYSPSIPPRVRTVVYVLGLAVGFLSIVATGVAAVWWPDGAAQVTATAGVASSAAAFLAGALGVAYRPTSNPTVADGTAVAVQPYD